MAVTQLWRRALHPAVFDAAEIADAELLNRFRDARDSAGFELLVYRHGPMVWATCRRIIGNHHYAEDAFQATFLALARRAGRIRGSVPGWLHRVAVNAALDLMRRVHFDQLSHQSPESISRESSPLDLAAADEVSQRIDAAINRLPQRLRRAVVLCELQGYSLKEAAVNLGCPVGTVESRLARARQKLRGLLAALRPTAAGVAAVAVVPRSLRAAVVRASIDRDAVSPAIAKLAARATVETGWALAAPAIASVLAAALLIATFGVGQSESPKPESKSPPIPEKSESTAKSRVDAEGVELPAGAIARLGSSRFRHGGWYTGEVAFSPDGRQLATGELGSISLFETSSGRLIHRMPLTEKQQARFMRFVADGKELAVGSSDWQQSAEVTLFNVADGKPARSSKFAGRSQIFVIDVTRDGSRVLVEDRFEKAYLWDIKAEKEVWAFKHPEAAFTLPMTADGKYFIEAMSQKAELRDVATGDVVREFPKPDARFRSTYNASCISPDGKLASATESGDTVAILDANGGAVRTFKGDRELRRLFFSPDSRYLVGTGDYGTLVWDTKLVGESAPITKLPASTSVGFSADGKNIALESHGYVTLWTVGDWKLLPQSADPASPVQRGRFTADGKHVIGYTQFGWVVWPIAGGPAKRLSDDSGVHHEGLADVSADRRTGVDMLHEPAPGRGTGKFAMRVTDFTSGKARRIESGKLGWNSINITADGRFVWMLGSGIQVWEASTGEVVLSKPALKGGFLVAIDLAADGKSITRSARAEWTEGGGGRDLLGPMYKAVYVTDHVTGREWQMSPTPWSTYSAGANFSPDGSKLILCGRFDRGWDRDNITVWDVRSGRRLVNWTRDGGRIGSVSLAPDGRSLLAGDRSGKLSLIEIASDRERTSFRHGSEVISADFHPDGTKIVASSSEAPVYVWDLMGDAPKWDATKADSIWSDLASMDAKKAFAAIRTLRANPVEAIAFLKERLKPAESPADAKLAAMLKQLDSPKFAERELAQKELTLIADLIQSKLQAARKTSSEEALVRIDAILKTIDDPTPDRLRSARACEVLEGVGSTDAIAVLRLWSSGVVGSKLTTEAQESVIRLKNR